MTKENFRSRFLIAIDKSFNYAKKFVFDELPSKFKFNLYHREKIEKYLRLNVDEVIEKLYRDGKIPRWININVAKIDGEYTIFACAYSATFTNDDNMLQFSDEPWSPFQIGGPLMSEKYSMDKKFYLEEFDEEENCIKR